MPYSESSSFRQLPTTPKNTVHIGGPFQPVEGGVTITVASARAGMLCVIDNGTYYNGVKPYANAAALYANAVVLDIKARPNLWVGKLNDPTILGEQYENWPALHLIPGMEFFAWVADDTDFAITDKLYADATNMGGLKKFTAAKGGAVTQLFTPLAANTSNTNALVPVRYEGSAIDGEA